MDVEPNPCPRSRPSASDKPTSGGPLFPIAVWCSKKRESEWRKTKERKQQSPQTHAHGPNFKSNGVTQEQLAKFRELRKRRLQMKNKFNNKKKHKDLKGKFLSGDLNSSESPDKNTNQRLYDPSEHNSSSTTNEKNEAPSSHPQAEVHPALKKKKLHWGLDTKERWERKANM